MSHPIALHKRPPVRRDARLRETAESSYRGRRSPSEPVPRAPGPYWQALALPVQAKLEVGAPGDAYEEEADQVADQVMRMPQPDETDGDKLAVGDGGAPGVQRLCSDCEEDLQRKPTAADAAPVPDQIVEGRIRGLSGGGRALDDGERAFFEPRLGRDLGRVRLHTGPEAADAARSIEARAFTTGRNIAFATGTYRPGTESGQRLLAHELAHVVQQGGDAAAPPVRRSAVGLSSGGADAAVQRDPGPPIEEPAPPGEARRQTEDRGADTESPAAGEEPPAEDASLLSRIWRWLLRLLREVLRVLRQLDTRPPLLPREAVPSGLSPDCRTFASQSDLDGRKGHWAGVIAGMPPADVVDWIIGQHTPPTAAAAEARQQMDCLVDAMRTSFAARGLTMPPGAAIRSGRRGFADQRRIWEDKFNFTRRSPFDRISDHARRTCGSLLLPAETKWNPREPRHRVCWNVAPLPGTTAPAMPSGARALTDDERQAEILQASSAPGISRHHWGTDFDIFDPNMDPAEWEAGQTFADAYSWLHNNAGAYGFIQSFTPFSTFMGLGYMEERWHWSYYPIAQALVETARARQADIEAALMAQWGSAPQFSFIRSHWRDFMFNVSEHGVF